MVSSGQGTYVEGIKEEVVLSPAHALSLIASGEGTKKFIFVSFLLSFRTSVVSHICFSNHALGDFLEAQSCILG